MLLKKRIKLCNGFRSYIVHLDVIDNPKRGCGSDLVRFHEVFRSQSYNQLN